MRTTTESLELWFVLGWADLAKVTRFDWTKPLMLWNIRPLTWAQVSIEAQIAPSPMHNSHTLHRKIRGITLKSTRFLFHFLFSFPKFLVNSCCRKSKTEPLFVKRPSTHTSSSWIFSNRQHRPTQTEVILGESNDFITLNLVEHCVDRNAGTSRSRRAEKHQISSGAQRCCMLCRCSKMWCLRRGTTLRCVGEKLSLRSLRSHCVAAAQRNSVS